MNGLPMMFLFCEGKRCWAMVMPAMPMMANPMMMAMAGNFMPPHMTTSDLEEHPVLMRMKGLSTEDMKDMSAEEMAMMMAMKNGDGMMMMPMAWMELMSWGMTPGMAEPMPETEGPEADEVTEDDGGADEGGSMEESEEPRARARRMPLHKRREWRRDMAAWSRALRRPRD